jgi:urate oxidase
MALLAENRYGKSSVRVVRLDRSAGVHKFQEWTVEILLEGDFLSCFTEGDNSKILPTDTMKNTVYSLARKSSATCIEQFAGELLDHFLKNNPQVSGAEIGIKEKSWRHLDVNGSPHPSTFVLSGGELQTTHITRRRDAAQHTVSGIQDLIVMKTADSGFEGYIHDPLTTLPETSDRLLGTNLRATWVYNNVDGLNFTTVRHTIRTALLTTFADHHSKSVQHTLYAMAETALAAVSQISEIILQMPNIHCLLADLSRFGQDNPNHIFIPIDEPHGTIEARVTRES